ncbi:SGNH/GDSL hydrolase family protein [Butyrivibrio sp. INlla21]|uniref:SGNH/GDSL hydrolase family protein n=1 Tax=Butyrivibrio sp. INlla21 TaxID=1520811 RepID=UPI0008ED9C9E|nr:SGNH/GDSL hydrolase family protein [Butyrivibrio sp. INlla21]SFU78551.1 GDSL-like Lipase/Acylhydrolase [Butyrivibrio sp. INlla21]
MKKKTIEKTNNLIVKSPFVAAFAMIFALGFLASGTVCIAEENPDTASEVAPAPLEVAAPETNPEGQAQPEDAAAYAVSTPFAVTKFETPVTMYVTETINVRDGAGTEYNPIGKLGWGNCVSVTGTTDNGWYEIDYNGTVAYIISNYVSQDIPGIPYLFVGDSRTVQLQMAVGSNEKAYVAKVGEGYYWFKNTAMPQIQASAGAGTTMVINFGVNDLANASKYIKLVNSNIDAWEAQGITVYYAAVTPVGDCSTVSNDQIEKFNARLQAELDPRIKWIDGYSFLKQNGFSASDGLHYNRSTYKNLYSYYMSVIGTDV